MQTQRNVPYPIMAFTAAMMLTALGALLWRAAFDLPASWQVMVPLCFAALPPLACGLLFGPIYGGGCGLAAALLGRALLAAPLAAGWAAPVLGAVWGVGAGCFSLVCRRKPRWWVVWPVTAAVQLVPELAAVAALGVGAGLRDAAVAAGAAAVISLVAAVVAAVVPQEWLPARWRSKNSGQPPKPAE